MIDNNDFSDEVYSLYPDEILPESYSDKLHSHVWNHSPNGEFSYVCEKCGSTAYGSKHGPTVYSTFVARNTESFSCSEVMVRNVLK